MVELPEPPVICVGLKDTVGPPGTTGNTLAVKETELVNPPKGATLTM